MSLIENLPQSVETLLKSLDGRNEPNLISVASDIDLSGRFGETWLIVNSSQAYVVCSKNGAAEIHKKINLKDIDCARTEPLVGGGVLRVCIDGRWVDLIYHSNAVADKFSRVARAIELIANDEPLPEQIDETKSRCEKCNRLLIKGTQICPKCVNKGRVMRRLLGYAWPYKWQSIFIATLLIVGNALALAPPYLTKILIDDVLNTVKPGAADRRMVLLVILVVGLVFIGAMNIGIAIVRGRAAAWLGSRLTLDIRAQLYHTLQRLSLSFFDRQRIGAIMTRITQDTGALEGFLVEGQAFLVYLLQLIGICVVLFIMNPGLAILVLLPTPLIAILSIKFGHTLIRAWHKFWQSWSRLGAMLNDSLSGIRVVRAFAQENKEISRFERRQLGLFEAKVTVSKLSATYWPFLGFVSSLGTYLVWYFGGKNVIEGRLTLGVLMAFIGYLGQFYAYFNALTGMPDWVSRIVTAAERVFEILDTEPEVADAPDAVPMPNIKGAVEFKNVTFGYERHKPVLRNINLKVEPGQMIGLVGPSGAGKTTFTNLICRFYDINEGELKIDGVDIRKIPMRDLRSQIGVVLQEPFLFNGSVAENIAYAKTDATREEIIRAAKAANAHDFIMKMPDGYDSYVGERGGRLSGGERQRISIARAILHDPIILILDEATSSVDVETEKQIQDALQRLVKNRTTFCIAHRLSTLKNADIIVVLEDGKIQESGSHDELLKKKGTYYRLVQIQTELSKLKAVGG